MTATIDFDVLVYSTPDSRSTTPPDKYPKHPPAHREFGGSARRPAAKRLNCIHLGPALPKQSGPCKHRVRKCDVHGECTIQPCTGIVEHSCYDKKGKRSDCYEVDEEI